MLIEEFTNPSIKDVQFILGPSTLRYCHNTIQARVVLCKLYKDLASSVYLNETYDFSETFKKQLPKTYTTITGKQPSNNSSETSTMQDIDKTLASFYEEQELIALTRL